MMAVPIASLKGKVAVITVYGIGASVARLFLKSGIGGLILVDLNENGLRDQFSNLDATCDLVAADASSEEDVERYVSQAVKRWGKLDIAILNAGVCGPLERTMKVNAQGVFLGIKHSGRTMMKNPGGPSGSIVITSSQLGLEAAPGLAAYSTSKFAARGLALNAAEELAPHIRVNCVCPGPVQTAILESIPTWPELRDKTLLKRIAHPDEIANAIGWLASDASYCTGTTLKVDGGYSKMG
ncbi:hypothetical protein BDQ17DRAFT_1347296 [Cyathus striatus]|nr:hypothetical protein BDQ17DRAFT_1347296 [Cyathus striatus]